MKLELTRTYTGRTRGRLLCTCLALLILGPAFSRLLAQGSAVPEWRLMNLGMIPGFVNSFAWPTSGSTLFFRDSLNGYYMPINELNPDVVTSYSTTDGGKTWGIAPEPIPVPHRMLTSTFGIGQPGHITRDGGQTWQRLRPNFAPNTSTLRYAVTSAIAGSPQHIAAFYQSHTLDAASGREIPTGPNRLAFSRNGGGAWTFLDSMLIDTISGTSDVRLRLYDSSAFGRFPAPANMTDTFSLGWSQLIGMPDTSTILVTSIAFGRVAGTSQNHYYLGRLDRTTMKATWQKLPFIERVPDELLLPPGIRFLDTSVGYVIHSRNEAGSTIYTLWRTIDGGKTWASGTTPDWIDYGSLRFLSARHAVAMNAITNDSGKTWQRWGQPFESGLFYASDSTHYFLANRFSLFARSTDAGHTWKRNQSGAIPRAVAAHNGRVIVGRTYQSILRSTDRGESWRDVGLDNGAVPSDLSTLWSVAFVDSVNAPDKLIGLATFTRYDATSYLAFLQSTDGGLTWTRGAQPTGLAGIGGTYILQFVQGKESAGSVGFLAGRNGLFVSEDGGATWTKREATLSYRDISMTDPENGVATTVDGIHATTDGGRTWVKGGDVNVNRNRVVGLQAFAPGIYRGLFPDRTQRNQTWTRFATDDGTAWTSEEHSGAPRALDGYAWWSDTANVLAVGRGATIQHSTDGGRSFTMMQDTTAEFKALGGYVVVGNDGSRTYVFGAGNVAGRWGEPVPTSVRERNAASMRASLLNNPLQGAEVVLAYALVRHSAIDVRVVDMLGNTHHQWRDDSREAGEYRAVMNLAHLPNGRYIVRVTTGAGATSLPLVIVR